MVKIFEHTDKKQLEILITKFIDKISNQMKEGEHLAEDDFRPTHPWKSPKVFGYSAVVLRTEIVYTVCMEY